MRKLIPYIILVLVIPTIQMNIFCDKTYKLSIDSVMTETKANRITFFVGQDFYELQPIDKNLSGFKITDNKKLVVLHETLLPPIEMAFFTNTSEEYFQIKNIKKTIYLEFFKNRTLKRNITYRIAPGIDRNAFEVIRMYGNGIWLRTLLVYMSGDRNEWGIKSFSSDKHKTGKHWLMRREKGSHKQIRFVNETLPEALDRQNKLFYQLKGQNITAAFVYNGYLHLLAGRHFCQMKISFDVWNDFCEIRDISNWIVDCQTTETTTLLSKTPTLLSKATILSTKSTNISSKTTTDGSNKMEMISNPTEESTHLLLTTALSKDRKSYKTLIIVIGIVLAVIMIIGWMVTIAVIWITYNETQARKRRDTSTSVREITSLSSASSVKSIKTVDSDMSAK